MLNGYSMDMTSSITQENSAAELLRNWLARCIYGQSLAWLDEKHDRIAAGGAERILFSSISAVTRYISKEILELAPPDIEAARQARRGWQPEFWSRDQAARTWLLLALPATDEAAYLSTLDTLFASADLGESVALYQSLPLLPHPEGLRARAAEGVRSNMTALFDAVALRNPYPADYFDDIAWNQMVLKAVFIGSPVALIDGLERRANPELRRMLIDYARERLAAGRPVADDVWRCIGPDAEQHLMVE